MGRCLPFLITQMIYPSCTQICEWLCPGCREGAGLSAMWAWQSCCSRLLCRKGMRVQILLLRIVVSSTQPFTNLKRINWSIVGVPEGSVRWKKWSILIYEVLGIFVPLSLQSWCYLQKSHLLTNLYANLIELNWRWIMRMYLKLKTILKITRSLGQGKLFCVGQWSGFFHIYLKYMVRNTSIDITICNY